MLNNRTSASYDVVYVHAFRYLKTIAFPDETRPHLVPMAPPTINDHLLAFGVASKSSVNVAGETGLVIAISHASPS